MIDSENSVPLREHVDKIFSLNAIALEKAFLINTAAIERAEEILNFRLEALNDSKRHIERLESTFATRDMLEPIKEFQNKLLGVLLGITVLNVIITSLICIVFKYGR